MQLKMEGQSWEWDDTRGNYFHMRHALFLPGRQTARKARQAYMTARRKWRAESGTPGADIMLSGGLYRKARNS